MIQLVCYRLNTYFALMMIPTHLAAKLQGRITCKILAMAATVVLAVIGELYSNLLLPDLCRLLIIFEVI